VEFIKKIENHTFKAGDYLYSMKDGVVKLSSFGQSVSPALRTEANKVGDQIKSQKFQIFHGPLSDRDGKVRVAAGKSATQQEIEQMDWVVSGVEGTLPKK
jgi:basic membrane protein A